MRKKLSPPIAAFIALAIMVALGACSNEELIPDAKPDTNPHTGRTLSLTASMPSEPTTRVGLTKEDDLSITLTWQAGDELQLAFVQGTSKAKSVATVKTISTNKKQATFDIEIPDGFDTGVYDLYGVYGGGGLSDANPTQVQLPTNAGNTTSLSGDEATSVQNRKDVILYFESKNIDAENPQASAIFQHLGSLFSFTLQNNGAVAIDDIKEVRLSSDEANNNWGFNTGPGNQVYDFETGFQNTETGSDYYIYFDATDRSIAAGEPLTLWAWYPPLPEVHWPALKIELIKTDNSTVASANALPARDNPTAAGKSYYFYAAWDGAELNFTNDVFTNELTIDVPQMGNLGTLLSPTQKSIVKKLIVTGQINKADYDVLKNQMPSLTYVDLSQVTSYEGDILNKIPDFAFGDIDMTSEENPFVDANQTIETVILPQSITVIGDGAFTGCMGIISALTIPDNVTTIGDMAFAASGFTDTLTIPNKVTTIGGMTFRGSNLKGLIFQDGSNLTSIGVGAFMECVNLTGELNLPASLVEIGDDAFSDCRFSGSLSIPDKVTKIGDSAFYGSKFTGSLIIPKEVITIADNAFQLCGFTGSLSFQDGSKLEAIGRLSFYDCGFTGPLVLPANLQTIGDKAFESCEGFTGNIVFPSTLTSIGKESFVSCNLVDAFQFMSVTPIEYTDLMLPDLKPVQVPSTVAAAKYEATSGWTPRHTIEGLFDGHAVHVATKGTLGSLIAEYDYALTDITNLKLIGEINQADYEVMKSQMPNLTVVDLSQVTSYEGETVNKIPDKAFGHIFINKANQTISTIILPKNTTVIGKSAFLFCKKLSGNLILPTSLVTIESAAFMHCTGLTGNLVLPAGLKTVGLDAFSGCTGFDGSLTLPATLETIEGAAFANCENITGKIVFPSKLTSIEYSGFYGCTSVTAFQFPHTTPITYTDDMLTPGTTVEVPLSAISLYLDNPDWVSRHPISVLVEVEVEVPPL